MANKYNGSVVVLDMGINGSHALNLLKKELSEETIVYINDLEISNYEGTEKNALIYADFMHCEKYATGYERADKNALRHGIWQG